MSQIAIIVVFIILLVVLYVINPIKDHNILAFATSIVGSIVLTILFTVIFSDPEYERILAEQNDIEGCTKASVSSCEASSSLPPEGDYTYYADNIADGDPVTSWQENDDGDGEGEWITIHLSDKYKVRYINFNMGNWRSEQIYEENNRPDEITLKVGDKKFSGISFPDAMKEYAIVFSKPIRADEIYIEIESVHEGSAWQDCCISEVTVFSK